METLASEQSVRNVFTRETEKGPRGSTRRIAFVHHKGGTGKTTACINIAGWLTKMKQKVLVVDLDPQGNATSGLGVDRATIDGSIYDVLFAERRAEEVLLETDSGVHLIPSSLDLLAAEAHLAGRPGAMSLLKERLEAVQRHFDYVLMDVPPGSTHLMANGMVASGNIVIPLDAGVFACETLEALKTLILDLQEGLGVAVNVEMLLVRGFSTSVSDWGLSREVRKMVGRFLAANRLAQVKVFPIPFSREVYRAQMKGMPISHFAPFSEVGRAYRRVATELLRNEG